MPSSTVDTQRMSSPTSSSLPLVWVTSGKTQHAAYLIDENDQECLIQWTSTQQMETVPAQSVQRQLSPRRRSFDVLDVTCSSKRARKSSESNSTESDTDESDESWDHKEPATSSPSAANKRQQGTRFSLTRCKPKKEAQPTMQHKKTEDWRTTKGFYSISKEKRRNSSAKSASTEVPCDKGCLNSNHDHDDGHENNVQAPRPSKDRAEVIGAINTQTIYKSDDIVTHTNESGVVDISKGEESDEMLTDSSFSLVTKPVSEYALSPTKQEIYDKHLSSSHASDPKIHSQNAFAVTPRTMVGFPLITSTYLQNMAEICSIIMQDGRWRVGGEDSETLLRWEDGVDLSAVTYLERCYIPPNKVQRKTPCQCLLCREKPSEEPQTNNAPAKKVVVKNGSETVDTPDEDVRWIYLFCRLFYRRGPWFRLDDVYDRYYKPGKRGVIEKIDSESDNNESKAPPEPAKENDEPVEKNASGGDGAANTKQPIQLDENLLREHIQRFSDLISDLSQLGQTGLIRAFRDEEECGKTVGVTLLTADMRASVLAKLGGAHKKPSNRHATPLSSGNAIWNQMKQQKSIVASFSGGNGSHLLPVRKHVDDVILNLLVASILKASCRLDSSVAYLPASIHKQHAGNVKQTLQLILRRDGQVHFSCFRLREEPLLALLRTCRLYLCATSGPGEMRSDDTNGWKSLKVCSGTPPLHKRIRRPGLDSWCFVSYPGNLSRFGITSSFFADAFKRVDPADDDATEKQMFFSRQHFLAWEAVVELRANVDYLLQLTELVRYETRRSEREDIGLDSKRSIESSFEGDSVDFLDLLSESGRRKTVKRFFQTVYQANRVCKRISGLLGRTLTGSLREWERVLIAVATLCICALDERHETIAEPELVFMETRPWNRHLAWEGCLSYILWDLIPLLERLEMHNFAVMSLKILIFGNGSDASLRKEFATRLAPLLLSRRARGMAYNRLTIDLSHTGKKETGDKSDKEKKLASKSRLEDQTAFCKEILAGVVETASVPFSAIRTLARRLKKPLVESLRAYSCLEAEELGLRLANPDVVDGAEKKKGYVDWTPITDFAVANNMLGQDASVGSRCVFVGYEDDSLNVEQLAMECYNTGKLPAPEDENESEAGWEGWHDEGGHIRAIFRIVCGGPLLGFDWGCAQVTGEHETVYISPHQGAPFDLHVGFEISDHAIERNGPQPTKSFYARRRHRIESFLEKLASLKEQEICDLVHDSVAARLMFAVETGRKDSSLSRDLENIRTLSLIAAGCGGRQLAAIFRCMLFDYRHYSGGLPDLLLVRALFQGHDGAPSGLVDLSDWVGESFSAEFQLRLKNQAGAAMLADEEFLGCSKVGDSGGTQMRSTRRTLQQTQTSPAKAYTAADLPPKLELEYKGAVVLPQCMMVEVKSSNDRLDPRQEDWLNVLDRYGNARVCKFEDSKTYKRRAQKEAKADK